MADIQVTLSEYEIDALAQWHREEQWKAANKEQYSDADWHKKRFEFLTKIANPKAEANG